MRRPRPPAGPGSIRAGSATVPIPGAGFYADSRYGAAACTHTGEMTMRCATARTVVLAMKLGRCLADALALAVEELAELQDGFLGGVVIHAVDAQGNHQVVNFRCQGEIRYWLWEDAMAEPSSGPRRRHEQQEDLIHETHPVHPCRAGVRRRLGPPGRGRPLDDIRAAGVVRIGVSLGGEPIGFRDAQNNPVGYDVDVATMLAEKLGVPLEFTDVSGDARISMLVSGQLDIVVANTSATLERAKSVDFTIPYNRAGLRVIVQADSGITSPRGPRGQVGRGRPRHHGRDLHEEGSCPRPSSSMSTTSRPTASPAPAEPRRRRASRTPRCSTTSPPRTPRW